MFLPRHLEESEIHSGFRNSETGPQKLFLMKSCEIDYMR